MSIVAKLAAVGVGGGALAVGGTYLWKHINDVMPPWHSLSEDNDYSTKKGDSNTGYKDKYSLTYSNYFVGIVDAADNKDPKSNDPWWDWIYLNIFSKVESHKGKFKEVKSGTGGENSTNASLKGVCTQAYKEEKNNGTGKIKENGEPGDDGFLEEDIWKYCSPIGQKPTSLDNTKNADEKSKYKDKLGQSTGKTSKFISVDDPGNEIFWQIRQEEFFATSGTFAPKNSDDNDTFFKSFYNSNKDTPENQRPTIKEKCRAAYLTSSTPSQGSTTNPTADNIVKYCSLEGK